MEVSKAIVESRRACVALGLETARVCVESHFMPSSLIKDVVLSENASDKMKTIEAVRLLIEEKEDIRRVGEELGVYRLERLLQIIHADNSYEKAQEIAKNAEKGKYGAESPASAFTYGELGPRAFVKIFRIARYRLETSGNALHFFDLGSGRGSNVFLAALVACDCNVYASGIEILPGLHSMAMTAAALFCNYSPYSVNFILGDFTATTTTTTTTNTSSSFSSSHNWVQADIVFANWICFDRSLIIELTTMAQHMNTGAILVTFTTAAQSMHFIVTDKLFFPDLPWGGPCTVFIHRKLSPVQHKARLAGKLPPSPYDSDQALSIPEINSTNRPLNSSVQPTSKNKHQRPHHLRIKDSTNKDDILASSSAQKGQSQLDSLRVANEEEEESYEIKEDYDDDHRSNSSMDSLEACPTTGNNDDDDDADGDSFFVDELDN